MNNSTIADFYTDKSVFLTGVSGLLGKVIVEKLLFSCPRINEIYVLLRGNKKKSAQEEFSELLSSKVFDRISDKQLGKIKLIEGDISTPDFGIDGETFANLSKKVNIIIHVAAVIKFNGSLSSTMVTNVVPVYSILKLAKSLEKFTGWTDSIQSMHGSFAGIMTGFIRSWMGKECRHDMVPLDYTSNYIIAATWFLGTSPIKDNVLVCNYVAGDEVAISIPELVRYTLEKCKSMKVNKQFRSPNFECRENPKQYEFDHVTKHLIPAHIIDGISLLKGKHQSYKQFDSEFMCVKSSVIPYSVVKRYERVNKEVHAIRFYTFNEWSWENENMKKIQQAMEIDDIKTFNFDMTHFDWKTFGGIMAEGINKFVLGGKMTRRNETNEVNSNIVAIPNTQS